MAKPILEVRSSAPLTMQQIERLKPILETLEMAVKGEYFVALLDNNVGVRVHTDNSDLVDAIRQQTTAIQALADSNMALVQAMADGEDYDAPVSQYLDGSPAQ